MDLLPDAMNRLEELKKETEATSYAEVAKNAFTLYRKFIRIHQEGSQIVVRQRDGVEYTPQFFLPD